MWAGSEETKIKNVFMFHSALKISIFFNIGETYLDLLHFPITSENFIEIR